MTYLIVKKLHTLSNELAEIDDDIGDQFVVLNEAAAIRALAAPRVKQEGRP